MLFDRGQIGVRALDKKLCNTFRTHLEYLLFFSSHFFFLFLGVLARSVFLS